MCVCVCVSVTSLVAQMVKASAYNAEDLGLIPGLGRYPGEGNGNPLQYSCLENPMDGGAWWATAHGVAKRRTQLSDFTFTFCICLRETGRRSNQISSQAALSN